MDFGVREAREVRVSEAGLNKYITQVFGWTFLGLCVTAATVAFFIVGLIYSPAITNFVATSLNYILLLSIVQLGLVIVLSSKIETMKPINAKLLYLFYAMSNGVFFTWVALSFDATILLLAFSLTAVTFGAMALYGIYTKTDLTKMGNMLRMGLFGLILIMITNIFIGSSSLDFLICVAGLFIFIGLTIYDTNKIKDFYYHSIETQGEDSDLSKNFAIYSALGLYLNFINIFMFILRLLARGRD